MFIMSFCITVGNWIKYDDDNVSAVLAEDVLKLSGGGVGGSCDPVM